MMSYEPLAYFHLIKFWNLHNLVTILKFDGTFDILFLIFLAFQSLGVIKKVFWRFTRPLELRHAKPVAFFEVDKKPS